MKKEKLIVRSVLIKFFLIIFSHLVFSTTAKKDEDFKIISNRYEELLIGSKNLSRKDPEIQAYLNLKEIEAEKLYNSMDKRLWRTFLWADLEDNTRSSAITEAFSRLRFITLALKLPGSKLEKNKKLKKDLFFALEWIYKNRYNESKAFHDNVDDWQINIPLLFNDIIFLLKEDLSKDQRRKFSSVILKFSKSGYQNTIDTTGYTIAKYLKIFTISSLMNKDKELLELVRHNFEKSVRKKIINGKNIGESDEYFFLKKQLHFRDWRISTLETTGQLVYLFRETSKELTFVESKRVADFFLKLVDPFIFKGRVIRLSEFSVIERPLVDSLYLEFLKTALLLGKATSDSKDFAAMVKRWLRNDAERNYLQADLITLIWSKELLNNNSIAATDTVNSLVIFPDFDKLVAKRPNFSLTLDLYSEKNKAKKVFNTSIERNTILGMTGIYSNSFSLYNGRFWKTIDPSKLPGITVVSGRPTALSKHNKGTKNSIASVNEIKGLYSVASMNLEDPGSSLRAKKSWFIFDNEIVMLGSGITGQEISNIKTTIENAIVDTDSAEVFKNGTRIFPDEDTVLTGTDWAFLGYPSDTIDNYFGTGYHFPFHQKLKVLSETRSARGITDSSLDTVFSDSYFTMQIDHGRKPVNDRYFHVVLPGMTMDSVDRYDDNPDVIILQNNNEVHAVREKFLNIIAANFWRDAKIELSIDANYVITCDKKASLISVEANDELEISLVDPAQKKSEVINIELINKPLLEVIEKDEQVGVVQNGEYTKITFKIDDSNGQNLKVKFKVPEKLEEIVPSEELNKKN